MRVQVGSESSTLNTETTDNNADEEEASEKQIQPDIIISSSGDMTPFTITIGKKGEQPRYLIRGNTDGTVTTQIIPPSA